MTWIVIIKSANGIFERTSDVLLQLNSSLLAIDKCLGSRSYRKKVNRTGVCFQKVPLRKKFDGVAFFRRWNVNKLWVCELNKQRIDHFLKTVTSLRKVGESKKRVSKRKNGKKSIWKNPFRSYLWRNQIAGDRNRLPCHTSKLFSRFQVGDRELMSYEKRAHASNLGPLAAVNLSACDREHRELGAGRQERWCYTAARCRYEGATRRGWGVAQRTVRGSARLRLER